jgi:DNA-binding transcriptional LysR family regulator
MEKMKQIQNIILFKQIVDAGSLSKAADQLEISVSQVSKRLVKLEKELGVCLIQRTTRNSAMTPAGELLYQKAQIIDMQAHEAWDQVLELRDEPCGQIKVAAHVSIGLRLVSKFIAEFIKRYPQIEVELYLDDNEIEFIEAGCDLAIRGYVFHGEQSLPDSGYHAKKILSLPVKYCASAKYIEQFGAPKFPNELIHHHCLNYSFHSSFTPNNTSRSWVFLVNSHIKLFPIKQVFSTNNPEALYSMVQSGAGIGAIPHLAIESQLTNGTLIEVLKEYNCERSDTFIFYANSKLVSKKIRLFIDELSQYCVKKSKL